MRIISLCIALLLAACSAENQPVHSNEEAAVVADAVQGQAVTIGSVYTISSKVLGMDRRLTVRVPYDYDAVENATREYPVVYLIDGGPEQDFPHIAGLAQLSDTGGSFGPFILVGVETVNRRAEISPAVKDPKEYEDLGAIPGGSAEFRRFLKDDVKPWVETHYRDSGRDAVMGESLAGLFTIETFLREPDLFDDYIAVSPSIWWEKMEYGKRAAEFLAQHEASDRRLLIYMDDVGYWTEEGTLMLVDALEKSPPAGLKWAFFDLANEETHRTIFHMAAIDALRMLYPVPDRVYRPHPSGSGIAITPRTPEMEARAAIECDLTNSRRTTPAQTRQPSDDLFYECLLYDYGYVADRGNM